MKTWFTILGMILVLNVWGQITQPAFLTQEMGALRMYSDIDLDGDLDIFMRYYPVWCERDDSGHHFQRWLYSAEDDFICKDISDMDGDGDDDVFGILFGEIGWYENDNSNNLWEWHYLMNGTIPKLLDVNNDGLRDIIFQLEDDTWVAHINNGNLSFGDAIPLTEIEANLMFSLRADFDHDGILDGVRNSECGAEDCLTYYLSSNGFEPLVSAPIISSMIVFVGDIDGDTAADIVMDSSNGYTQIYVLSDPISNELGNQVLIADGDFTSPAFLDFDSDGDVDMIAIDQNGYQQTVIELNDGLGNFTEQDITILPFDPGISPPDALFGDTDADGDLDLQIDAFNFENMGNNTFQAIEPDDYILGIQHIVLDVNGDGTSELLSYMRNILYFNDDNRVGEIVPMPTLPFDLNYWQDFSTYFVQDYNLDGMDDIFFVGENYMASGAVLFLSNGIGYDIHYQKEFEGASMSPDNPRFADIDGNGLTDYVFTDGAGAVYAVYVESDLTISDIASLCDFGENIVLHVADFDFDGHLDIFNLNQSYLWFHNNGDETFTAITDTPNDDLYYASVDFNIDLTGDGIPDFADAVLYELSENNGFEFVNSVDPEINVTGPLVWLNLNGDPFIDFIVLQNAWDDDNTNNVLESYFNLGNLNFQLVSSLLIESTFNIIPVRGLDTDGDGLDELLWTSLNVLDGPWWGDSSTWLEYIYGSGTYFISENEFSPEQVVSGHLFNDTDGNGIWSAGETGIGYVPISLQPEGVVQFAQNAYFWYVPEGNHEVSISYDNDVWVPTTPTNYSVSISESTPSFAGLDFGFSPINDEATIDLQVETSSAICGSVQTLFLQVVNVGGYTTDVQITLQLDSLLSFDISSIIPDSLNGQSIFWQLNNLPSGYSESIAVYVLYPNSENVGSQLSTQVTACALDTNDEIIMCDQEFINEMVLCSYDPNDKQVSPQGFSEAGFVLNDTELEYTIRFQNTGNAPATNLRIEDPLSEHLNWNTLQPIAWSHEISEMHIDETGRLFVNFDNIMLPDSGENFLGSQGFITYKIMMNENLPPFTEIENNAEIYFDLNNPVITNTTLNTIMDCDGLADFTLDAESGCPDIYALGHANSIWGQSYLWTIDDIQVSQGAFLSALLTEPGTHEITLHVENPLCDVSSTQSFTVYEVNAPSIIIDGNLLTAIGSGDFQWYLNGMPIEGATSSEWQADEDGNYSVGLLDENGCYAVSEVFSYVSVNENSVMSFQIVPNPVTDFFTITFSSFGPGDYFTVTDAMGRVVFERPILTKQHWFDVSGLANGVYTVRMNNTACIEKLIKQ